MNAPSDSIILASSSPRRQELLSLLGWPFQVENPGGEVPPDPGDGATDYAVRMAEVKAASIATHHPESMVIAADTVVAVDDHVLGKPVDAEDAKRMLNLLSNRTHQVTTGLCLRRGETVVSRSVTTDVTMKLLSDGEIQSYVETGEPMDKAGAYAIQGGAASMVTGIQGSYTNVVGRPLAELEELLKEPFGFRRNPPKVRS